MNIMTHNSLNEKEAITERSIIYDMIRTEAIDTKVVTEHTAQNTTAANEETDQGMKEKQREQQREQ